VLIAKTVSPDTVDTASLLRRLEAKFDALSAVATDTYPTATGTNVHSSVLSAFRPSFFHSKHDLEATHR